MYSSKSTSVLSKLISGALAALLLLPMLVFTALPNTIFGYSSSTNQGVADFTASAQRLTNAILPSFSDYDDYQVTDGSGGMNQNWLIAIGSVRYKQDLNVMDDNALEDLLYGKLDYSASITDTDGTGYYGTDYGDIVFSNAETPVVYYNQTDARWGNKPYGKTSTIGRAGCGPTALAIAVASLTNNKVTPYDVAQWSVENGGLCEGSRKVGSAGGPFWVLSP